MELTNVALSLHGSLLKLDWFKVGLGKSVATCLMSISVYAG